MAEKKVTILIEGMHCSHCSAAVAEGLRKLKGVVSANVLLTTGKAKVAYDPDAVNADDMVKIIEGLGYKVKGTRE